MFALWLGAVCVHGGVIFTNLFSFGPLYDTNGVNPLAGLVRGTDGRFYGTTSGGSSAGYSGRGPPTIRGTIFSVAPEGVLTTLVWFNRTNGDSPQAGLVQGNDGNFYGTTAAGGKIGYGTIFRMSESGSLTTLVSLDGLTGTNGWWPMAVLTQGKNGELYGTTYQGGTKNLGTVFRIDPNGDLMTLVSFDGTNGAYPRGELTQDKTGNFYGTTAYGGAFKGQSPPENSGYGTVFRLTTDGNFTTLFSFNGTTGREPRAGLAEGRDGNFYGTTRWGGSYGKGTVFRISPTGAFSSLFSFNGTNGAWPCALLVRGIDDSFIGTTETGGLGYNGTPAYGNGTVFRITTNGTLTTLVFFNGTNGVNPSAGLVQGTDGNFYGTTTWGGAHGSGTVFRFGMTLMSVDILEK